MAIREGSLTDKMLKDCRTFYAAFIFPETNNPQYWLDLVEAARQTHAQYQDTPCDLLCKGILLQMINDIERRSINDKGRACSGS